MRTRVAAPCLTVSLSLLPRLALSLESLTVTVAPGFAAFALPFALPSLTVTLPAAGARTLTLRPFLSALTESFFGRPTTFRTGPFGVIVPPPGVCVWPPPPAGAW